MFVAEDADLVHISEERLSICLEAGVPVDTARRLADETQNRPSEPGTDDLDPVALYTILWRRFFRVENGEPIELCRFEPCPSSGKRKIITAYPQCEADHIRLLREADSVPGSQGAYAVFNRICPSIASHGERWAEIGTRAKDASIRQIRAAYIDVDAVRKLDAKKKESAKASGSSATDTEKKAARLALHDAVDCLHKLGLPVGAIAHGDSGNGFFIFIALEPIEPTDETTAKIRRLLTILGHRLNSDSAKIDSSVANPSRLAPAPGTWKRKGEHTAERPHRRTSFCCPHTIVPIRIGDL